MLIFLYFLAGTTAAQEIETKLKKEYATVAVKVYYQGNRIVYDEKGLSKSPIVTLPDGKTYFAYDTTHKYTTNEKGEFNDIGQLINSFASYGWQLSQTNVLNFSAGDRKSTSVLIDSDQYLYLLVFERVSTTK
jgi:hypothetical protein